MFPSGNVLEGKWADLDSFCGMSLQFRGGLRMTLPPLVDGVLNAAIEVTGPDSKISQAIADRKARISSRHPRWMRDDETPPAKRVYLYMLLFPACFFLVAGLLYWVGERGTALRLFIAGVISSPVCFAAFRLHAKSCRDRKRRWRAQSKDQSRQSKGREQ